MKLDLDRDKAELMPVKARMDLVMEVIRGKTSVENAAKLHKLKLSVVQGWYDDALSGIFLALEEPNKLNASQDAQDSQDLVQLKADYAELEQEVNSLYGAYGRIRFKQDHKK